MSRTYRAAVIGASGMGGYGHRLDAAFLEVEGVELVAVADHEPAGLAAAGERLGVSRLYRYTAPRVLPDLEDLAWEMVVLPQWHGLTGEAPNLLRGNWLDIGNKLLARDLVEAVESGREPLSSIHSVRFVNEMVQGVYSSHLSAGRRIPIPLTDRAHPLGDR